MRKQQNGCQSGFVLHFLFFQTSNWIGHHLQDTKCWVPRNQEIVQNRTHTLYGMSYHKAAFFSKDTQVKTMGLATRERGSTLM